MNDRDRRLAQNEAFFRDVNDRIGEAAGRFDISDTLVEYVCECADTDCTMLIGLTRDEYERVRAAPDRFAVAPEHDLPEIEDVAETCERYWTVEKRVPV